MRWLCVSMYKLPSSPCQLRNSRSDKTAPAVGDAWLSPAGNVVTYAPTLRTGPRPPLAALPSSVFIVLLLRLNGRNLSPVTVLPGAPTSWVSNSSWESRGETPLASSFPFPGKLKSYRHQSNGLSPPICYLQFISLKITFSSGKQHLFLTAKPVFTVTGGGEQDRESLG